MANISKHNVFVELRLHLFGEYNGPLTSQDKEGQEIKSIEEKSLEKAVATLPKYFAAMYSEDQRNELTFLFTEGYMQPRGYNLYRYMPDLELCELTKEMQEHGYTQEQIDTFIIDFTKQMLTYEKVFLYSMHLRLFGKIFKEMHTEMPEEKSFEKALSFVPAYIDFLTGVYEQEYLYEGSVDLDEELHYLLLAMEEQNFSQEEQMQFVTVWFRSIEAQGKMSLMLMRVYLFGRFGYKSWWGSKTLTLLPEEKSFSKAMAVIPDYLDYMMAFFQPWWDDGVQLSPSRTLEEHLMGEMREFGYSDAEIDAFRTKWLDYMALRESGDGCETS